MHGQPPPEHVVQEFGAAGTPQPLPGGQATAWRVGAVVFKPLDVEPGQLAWQASLLSRLDGRAEFRVAPPLRSADGALVVGGWTAWRSEPGSHPRDEPAGTAAAIIGAGRALHAALSEERRPAFLAERTDWWAVADRVAWGESPVDEYAHVEHIAPLLDRLRPVTATAQLIHGDLSGNVLFCRGRPPLIIDLSPYWRPTVTADAIVIADLLVFRGAGARILDAVADVPNFAQYLLRALIFRAVTDLLTRAARGRPGVDHARSPDGARSSGAQRYLPAVRLAMELAG